MVRKAPKDRTPIRYADAGVDIAAGNRLVELIRPAVESTKRSGADGTIGGFGGLFDLKAAGYADPVLVASTDGVGTKLKLAIDAGILDTIGIDLVAMCVNDLVVQGAEPLFFLDYYATGKLTPERAAIVVEGIAEGCRIAGAALIGGETAEMPGVYSGDDFDIAGFAVGAVERGNMLPRTNIDAGDVVLGMASTGIHSNGYSLVRRLVSDSGLSLTSEAPFARGATLGDVLLTPTRIYVPTILRVLRQTGRIKALAHITGGGITENLPRVLPAGRNAVIDLRTFPLPPVFGWLREVGNMEDAELLRTFNCGIGMVAVTAAEDSDAVVRALRHAGETTIVVGEIKADDEEEIHYVGRF